MKNLFYPSRIFAEGACVEEQRRNFAPDASVGASKEKVRLILVNSLMHLLIRLDVWSVA